MMTQEEIVKHAARYKELGVPDSLNRWLTMTPQSLEDNMAKIGAREQALREMREQEVRDKRRGHGRAAIERMQKPAILPAQPKEDVMAKKTTKKKNAPKKANAAKAKAAPRKTKAASADRSPLAIGNFIAARGKDGCPMADLQKKFNMPLTHSLRSKMHDARHKLGFKIEYDAERAVYVGEAPKAAANA